MKLKKLKICNIASISDARIDFDSPLLRGEPIFLLCGETGSGKTMILDSICLALYNNTPRLSQASRSESYTDANGSSITLSSPVQYLRKGAAEASISLDFEAGGKPYTARWSVARAFRKAEGKFQGIRWEVEDVNSHVTSRGAEIEKIIGLGFDEFRRTVMLAQGDFTAFLKSRDDEKARILEKITGTGIYREIGRRISENCRNAQSSCMAMAEAVSGMMEQLWDDQSMERAAHQVKQEQEKAELKKNLRLQLENLRNILRGKEAAQKDCMAFSQKLEQAEGEYARLSEGLDYAKDVLRQEQERLEAMRADIGKMSSRDALYRGCALILKDLETLSSDRALVKRKKEEIEELKVRNIQTEKELEKNMASLSADEAECEKIRASVREVSKKRDALEPEKMKALKSILERITALGENVSLLEDKATLTREAVNSCKAKDAELSAAYDQAGKYCLGIEQMYGRMMQTDEQWAREARARLHPSDLCPVCGREIPSQEFLDSISDGYFESLLAPVRQELEKAKLEKEACYKAMTDNRSNCKAMENLLSSQMEELEGARLKLQKAISLREESGFAAMQIDKVEQALASADSLTREIESLSGRLSEMSSKVVSGKDAAGRLALSMEASRASMAAAGNLVEETSGKIAKLTESLNGRLDEGWLRQWEADEAGFTRSLSAQAREYLEKIEQASRLEAKIDKVGETVSLMCGMKEGIMAKDGRFGGIASGKRELIKDQPSLWTALGEKVASALNGLEDAKIRLGESEEAIAKAVSAIPGADLDSLTVEKVEESLERTSMEITGMDRAVGSMLRQLEIARENRVKFACQMDELKKLELSRDRWKALNDVFGKKEGEYFQKIAQGFIMNDILSRANHYLHQLSRRYVLESQPGSLGIMIRDTEQGGVVRSTSTISGGEGFIISLALALGLSSLTVEGDLSSDIIFIDEGFGTLSEDCLDTVTQALQRLNEKGGKRVGIISHVKELRERISVKISVTKTSPTESSVTVSL